MGSSTPAVAVMQFLILASVLVAAQAQLVAYPNGAVAPFDPNNAAATKEHFAALNEAGAVVNPYFTLAQDLAVPAVAPVVYAGAFYGRKKRSAEPQVLGADGLVTYPNGAVAPFDPNVALATANHYAAKAAYGSWVPAAGAANVHPAAVPAVYAAPYVYGRKKREADAQVLLAGAAYHPYAYGIPYAVPVVAPFVAHPNGAIVPLEPEDVVKARADHLAAVAEALSA